MKVFYSVLLVLFVVSACKSKHSEQPEEQQAEPVPTFWEIDLSDVKVQNDAPLLLSDIVEDVDYVKLETTEQSLVGEIVALNVTEKGIFTLDKGDRILRFDRTSGKFINTIGRIGQGPGEMISPGFVKVKDSLVYVPENLLSKIHIYTIDNKFIQTVPITKYNIAMRDFTPIENKYIMHHPGNHINYVKEKDAEFVVARIQDLTGKEMFIKHYYIPGINTKPLDVPLTWPCNNSTHIYDEIVDTIYAITKDSIIPRYSFKLGKNKWPIETETLLPEQCKYIKLISFRETQDYLYLLWCQNTTAYIGRVDKKTGKLLVHEQVPIRARFWHLFEIHGLPNDIDGCSYCIDFKRNINYDGDIAVIITPENVDEVKKIVGKSTSVKFPQKRKELLKLLNTMGIDDNPIIAIYKLKK